jgi:hypothetical protein
MHHDKTPSASWFRVDRIAFFFDPRWKAPNRWGPESITVDLTIGKREKSLRYEPFQLSTHDRGAGLFDTSRRRSCLLEMAAIVAASPHFSQPT